MIHNITPSIDYNLCLKCLDTQINEPNNKNFQKTFFSPKNLIVNDRMLHINGCRIYMDIMTGEEFSSIQVVISLVIYWLVRLSSRSGGNGVIVILARYSSLVHCTREHENLV